MATPPGTRPPTVLDLVERAQRGEILALEALFARYRDELVRECVQGIPPGLRRRFGADDVLQDALTAAWGKIGSFRYRGRGSFRAWLRQILANALRDGIKHHFRDMRTPALERKPAPEAIEVVIGRSADRPDERFWRGEEERRVRDAMGSLPLHLRAVAELRANEPELAWSEIGRRVGCSASTARRRFEKARSLIRSLLGTASIAG